MENVMNTIKATYSVMIDMGVSKPEARMMIIETLRDMGYKMEIADEIING